MAMCRNSTEENKKRYEGKNNKVSKAVSRALREKAEEAPTELNDCPNGMFRLVKRLKIDRKKLKMEDALEDVLEICISVKRKEVSSERIMWI